MKEYLLKKYKKYNKFSVFGAGDEQKKYYKRLQANAERIGNTFQRLNPPFASDLKLSTADLTTCDLISEGPIEGFVNSKGESCSALEATYLDGTVVAEPKLTKQTVDPLTLDKINAITYDFSSFASGKLNSYARDLETRFVHKQYPPAPYFLNAYETKLNGTSVREVILPLKQDIDNIINNTAGYLRDVHMTWNPGYRYDSAGNVSTRSTSLDPADNRMSYRKNGYGYRKVPYSYLKIYHPNQVNYTQNFNSPPNPYQFQTNHPVIYQGSSDFGASINSSGRLEQSFCARAFSKTLTHHTHNGVNDYNHNRYWHLSAMRMAFGNSYNSYFPNGKPSKYRYGFADDFEPTGLKEPIIDSVAEKINDLGLDYWKPYRFYNSDPSIITNKVAGTRKDTTYSYPSGLYNLFTIVNTKSEKVTILGKHADKFTMTGNNVNAYFQEGAFYEEALLFKPYKTYRFTGSIYMPSTNNTVNSVRIELVGGSTKTALRITGGTTEFPFNQWNDFDFEYTIPDSSARRSRWRFYESNNGTPGANASGDFFALNDFTVLEKTTGRDVTVNTGNFAYMNFSADDFFGGDSFAKDYELTYSVDGDRLEIGDKKGLGFSFPELTGFDLKSKSIRESMYYEYQIQSQSTRNDHRYPILTGASNSQNIGVELTESTPNKFKGAFLYPVYLGERFIPLESDGTIDTNKIFIYSTDSLTVSGNKLQSGISGDYDVFSTKYVKIGEEDIIIGQQLILNSGISGTRYAGYYSDNVNFSRATVQAQYYTNSIQQGDFGSSYTTEFVGFFRARHNGVYGFRVASDDASHLWIGDQATGGFTTNNATINNGGLHANTSKSANVTLQSGKVYGFRVMQGESNGSANFNVYFTPPGGTETSNFAGYFYTYSGSNKIDPEVLNVQNDSGFYNFTNDASGTADLFDKQDVSGSRISYAHVANPNIKVPDVEVTGKNLELKLQEKTPTLFNFSNFEIDFNLGEEDQKPIKSDNVVSVEFNKSIFGPNNSNKNFDSSLSLDPADNNNQYSDYGMRQFSAIDGTDSSDVESDGTFQSDWMATEPLDTDSTDVVHLVTRKEVDCVKVTLIIESLYQEIIAEQDPLGVSIKRDALQINFSVFTSFEGVPDDVYAPVEKKISYYGTVMDFYAVDTDEIELPSYDEILEFYPNETKSSLSERFPKKVLIRKNDFETTSVRLGRSARVYQVLEIIKEKFSYPFSSVIKTKIDARTFNDPPNKQYQLRLRKIQIPSNYFPLDLAGRDKRFVEDASTLGTKIIYEGDWDGTFKIGWTDNPAWILYDVLTNPRYGLGNRIDNLEDINIFNLYKIGRYCDAVDGNGHFVGVSNGIGGLEPRFSCNIMLDISNNAFETIKDISSVFNGMAFWANGSLDFFADQPKDPTMFFNNGNVFDGIFNYQTTNKSSLFNIADVSYQDKRDDFAAKTETFIDEDGMRENGALRRQVNARGAASRSQAARLGRYIIYSNKLEREIVNFKAPSQALMLSIGDIIEIQDELKNFEVNYAKVLEKDFGDTTFAGQGQFRYFRFLGTNSDNTATTDRQAIKEIHLIDDSSTIFPTTDFSNSDLAGGGSDTTGPYIQGGLTVTAGYSHSVSYGPHEAFGDSNMWWTLGLTDASLNYLDVDFGSAKSISQIQVDVNSNYHYCPKLRILASNDASFNTFKVFAEINDIANADDNLTIQAGTEVTVSEGGSTSTSSITYPSNKSFIIENKPNTNSIINNHSGAFVMAPTGRDKLSELYDHVISGGFIGNQELDRLDTTQAAKLKITGVTDLTTKIKIAVEDTDGYFDLIPTGTLINLDLQNRTPKQYRVLTIKPEESNLYAISATEYRREKFDLIENSVDFTLDDPEPFSIGILENEIKTLTEPEGFSSQVVNNNYGQQIDFEISGNLTGSETAYQVSVIQPNGNVESKRIAKQSTTQNGYFKTTGTFKDIVSFGTYTFEVKSIDSKDIFGGVEFSKYNTSSNTDSDGDGLSDWDEIYVYGTDKNNTDSDGDGLSDGDEVNTHNTDPLDTDSDADGLSDSDEINTHNTDPNDADSDDDGFSDSLEVDEGTDPNDDTDFPVEEAAQTMQVTGLGVNSAWQGTWTKVASVDGEWSKDGGINTHLAKVNVNGTEVWEMEFPEYPEGKWHFRSEQDTTTCPYPWMVFSWEFIGFRTSSSSFTGEPYIYGAKDSSSNLITPTNMGTEVRSFDFDANIPGDLGAIDGTYIYSGYMKGLPFYTLSGGTNTNFSYENFLPTYHQTSEFSYLNLGLAPQGTVEYALSDKFDETKAYGETLDPSGYLLWSNEFTWTGFATNGANNEIITPTFSNFKDKDGNTVSNP